MNFFACFCFWCCCFLNFSKNRLWIFEKAAFTILVGSHFGLPLSTTQVLVGAVIGVGFARGIAGLNLLVIRKILGSWLITLPATCFISACLNLLIKIFV